MRTGPVAFLKESTHPLVVEARKNADALVIESDGDEIPSALPLLHLKRCDFKDSSAHVRLPAVFYKHSTHMLASDAHPAWHAAWVSQNMTVSTESLQAFATHSSPVGPVVLRLSEVST
jgi:hypothetical protein